MRKLAIIAIILVFLGAFGVAVAQKEKQLANGQVVLLALWPVDPFSLIQGHYVALDFELASAIHEALAADELKYLAARQGTAIITLDENKVGRFKRLDNDEPLAAGELKLRFKLRKGEVLLASGAFFFQDGYARYFENAQYAELRLDSHGRPLIANLLNSDFTVIDVAAIDAMPTNQPE